MIDHRSNDEQFGARLVAAEYRGESPVLARSRDASTMIAALATRERETEDWMRAVAMYAWLGAFAFVLLSGFMYYLSGRDVELVAELGHGMKVAFAVAAAVSLLLAIMMTAAWLYRTRGMSSAQIERRLAALEASVRSNR